MQLLRIAGSEFGSIIKNGGKPFSKTHKKKSTNVKKSKKKYYKVEKEAQNKHQCRFFTIRSLLKEADIFQVQNHWWDGQIIANDSSRDDLILAHEYLTMHPQFGEDFELGEIEEITTESGEESVQFLISMEGHGDYPDDDFKFYITGE